MKKFIKKLAVFTLSMVLVIPLFYFPLEVNAEDEAEYMGEDLLTDIPEVPAAAVVGTTLDIKAKSVVLMEPHTGNVLYENNADERLAPASITKIMSLLLVMEAIENEKLTLDTKVSASEHAASMGGSQIWLEVGEEMTVDELLRASVIASANDATVALAEAVSGSEETFVSLMNERAKELGMKNTTFVNCCGLDTDGHLTSGRDVAIMASALIKHDLIKKYSTVWMDALRNGKSELTNTNKLVRYYSGATGLKTGTTSKAGCCVAATAERDGMELVAVVMGGETSNERFTGAKKLLDYGFANWSFVTLTPDLGEVGEIPVLNGMEKFITADSGGGAINLLLSKGNQDKVTQIVEINENIEAPVLTGDIIGNVKFMSGEKKLGELPVYSANTVERVTFFNALVLLISMAIIP
ncbi:MAG: D-alanyl-D-alanine carboxypeptidase family protein [Acutalibacteraceae bacterium]|nr:D-alanyl-D-alanine carboxypeptidase family protein [Acutalibacteraceae bacterium]